MIILEEDLDVSTDIFWYFHQLLPLLKEDESLYCVSAWNDQVSVSQLEKSPLPSSGKNLHLYSVPVPCRSNNGCIFAPSPVLNTS